MNIKMIIQSALMLLVMTVVLGIVYPIVITLATGAIFPSQAAGSLQTTNNTVVGSALIGQQFTSDRYFWSRPSAIVDANSTPAPYGITADGSIAASAGSNLGPTSADLQKTVQQRAVDIRIKYGMAADTPIPTDLLFASGSGLDPHISPEAARLQIDRIATARGLSRDKVAALVEQYVEGPQLGILGQPRVNVLMLNLALDQMK